LESRIPEGEGETTLRNFHSRAVHPDIIKSFIYATECNNRFKLILKFKLKFSYMFWLTNYHHGAYCRALLKLWLFK